MSSADDTRSVDSASPRILVVGERARLDLEAILASPDREIVAVGSGADALREVASGDYALVVLSAQMPVMDGFETASKIKTIERARHVPVLLVAAGERDPSHVMKAYRCGAVDLVQGDFELEPLRAKVSLFVELYQAREQVRRHAEHLAATLARADELQQQFLATLGRELRPPLNAILGWVRMLRDGSIREVQRGRALENVERNATAQLELIDDMIDISRMTSGNLALELGTVDLQQVVAQAVEAVRPAALEKQVMLLPELDDRVAPISGDAERLLQIVHRLVRDAVSCTPTEGVVAVSLGNVGPRVEIAIADSGPGVEPELVPRLFDRFQGRTAGTPRAAGGLGVDLALVRHLVELHDGTIRVESPGAGLGCRFVVSLPPEGRKPRTDDEVR